jgi:transposase-like protein/DDE family transposase
MGFRAPIASIEAEFENAELADQRLDRRLIHLATLVAASPGSSFPIAAGNDANLEATYRFLNNDRITPEEILAPHTRQTVRRATSVERLVVAHDTTEFNFGRFEREDLGRVGRGKSFGFYGHFSIAVDFSTREPLGVVGLRTHERSGDKGRRGHEALQIASDNEFRRWFGGVSDADELLRAHHAPIHVMDREADSYGLMAELVRRELRFVIRMASQKRRTGGDTENVAEALVGLSVVAERDVPITARRPSAMPAYRKHFPERNARSARLKITSTRVTLLRPDSANRAPAKTLTLNVVHVFEPEPPEGEPAIEWRLWTDEPVDTAEQVLAVVDAYRCRWVIEEYFKSLKTGCAFEKRQLESKAALLNALAVFVPIAWRLLLLRTLARDESSAPATRVLTPLQLKCLASALRRLNREPLAQAPTVRDAMLGVAGLGGHIKNNGDPGWMVLGRGLEKLLTIELGYIAATEEM